MRGGARWLDPALSRCPAPGPEALVGASTAPTEILARFKVEIYPSQASKDRRQALASHYPDGMATYQQT